MSWPTCRFQNILTCPSQRFDFLKPPYLRRFGMVLLKATGFLRVSRVFSAQGAIFQLQGLRGCHLSGRRLLDVASDVRNGKLSASQLPLSVVMHGQQYWTLNNRSLYAAWHAEPLQEKLWIQSWLARFTPNCRSLQKCNGITEFTFVSTSHF